MRRAAVLQYTVKPSMRLAVALLLLHVIAAIVVCVTVMPLPVKQVMLLIIFLSLSYCLARDVLLLLPDSWRYIAPDQNSVSVIARDGSSLLGQVANKTVVSPYFVVLRVRLEVHRRLVSRVIFPDALNADEFRELCVSLKFA